MKDITLSSHVTAPPVLTHHRISTSQAIFNFEMQTPAGERWSLELHTPGGRLPPLATGNAIHAAVELGVRANSRAAYKIKCNTSNTGLS